MKITINHVLALLFFTICWGVFAQAFGEEAGEVPLRKGGMTEQQPSATDTIPDEDVKTAPVSGAFGILLGEKFELCTVLKILAEEEHNYTGPDKTRLTGKLYHIEPRVPSQYFNQYVVKTTEAGIIYTVQGHFESVEKENLCTQTKHLAALLEEKYGKFRGKGMLGDWYTIRETTEGPYRGIRFYAPKCRHGRYTINYVDEGAKGMEVSPQLEPTEMTGL